MDDREILIVKEYKKNIEKIKKKYNNMEMADDVAGKIASLEIVEGALSVALVASGLVTVVDLVVPDPVLGIDEALLTMLTGSIEFARGEVKRHIGELAATGKTEIKSDEVNTLTSSIKSIVDNINEKRSKTV